MLNVRVSECKKEKDIRGHALMSAGGSLINFTPFILNLALWKTCGEDETP